MNNYLQPGICDMQPQLVSQSSDIPNGNDSYTRGCAFSPDGLCVLTCTSVDNTLRLYNTPPPVPPPTSTSTSSVPPTRKDDDESVPAHPHEWRTALTSTEANMDTVRGYQWYPLMNSSNPATCAFLSYTRGNAPIQLIDAYSGKLRGGYSYSSYDDVDAIVSPHCVTFNGDGSRIYGGFDRVIRVFDTNIPGRDCEVLRLGKTRRSRDGQKGIVSAMATQCGVGVLGVGSYLGSIYLYDERQPSDNGPAGVILSGGNRNKCVVGCGKGFARKRRRKVVNSWEKDDAGTDDGNVNVTNMFAEAKLKLYQKECRRGITQLRFGNGGNTLYSAGRCANAVLSWDIRTMSDCRHGVANCLASYPRDANTNQRLEFDVFTRDDECEVLLVAGRDRCVKLYDVQTRTCLTETISGLPDVANGVSAAKCAYTGKTLVAVSTGSRRFEQEYSSDDDESIQQPISKATSSISDINGTLQLYKLS